MKIAIIGEFDKDFRPHVATNEAIEHTKSMLSQDFKSEWISTEFLEENMELVLNKYQGFWIAPGSPYKSMKGAINLIEFTRTHNIPTFGTCGGFQHMVIEYARNVFDLEDAAHAEYDPYASRLVVEPLTCDLKGEPLEIEIIDKDSRVFSIYQSLIVKEKYYCNFGLNPEYQALFNKSGFKIVGSDKHKEARIVELKEHPFFIATLFVPQDNSTFANPHKLVTAFIKATLVEAKKRYIPQDM